MNTCMWEAWLAFVRHRWSVTNDVCMWCLTRWLQGEQRKSPAVTAAASAAATPSKSAPRQRQAANIMQILARAQASKVSQSWLQLVESLSFKDCCTCRLTAKAMLVVLERMMTFQNEEEGQQRPGSRNQQRPGSRGHTQARGSPQIQVHTCNTVVRTIPRQRFLRVSLTIVAAKCSLHTYMNINMYYFGACALVPGH